MRKFNNVMIILSIPITNGGLQKYLFQSRFSTYKIKSDFGLNVLTRLIISKILLQVAVTRTAINPVKTFLL